MVGNYDDFDITFVDREDKGQRWLICDIDLKEDIVPHLLLIPRHQKESHYDKVFRSLRTLEPMELHEHSADFESRYQLYFTPEHTHEVQEILPPSVTRTIAAHFWPLAIEVWDGTLFIYSAEKTLTTHDLETVIKNGTWLAQVLTLKDRAD
jgi:hypothetical protein